MTVEETAAYHAALTLPTSSIGQRKERIHIVLQEIGLAHVASSLVGGMLPGGILLRGLSGGERRRLAIATVLMAGGWVDVGWG
jgi:ATP-binding cassette subfamily G (WHITE) protein 2